MITTPEMIEAILRRHIKVDATGLSPSVASAFIVGIEDASREVAALPFLPGEPVAWLWEHPSYGKELMFKEPRATIDAGGWTVRPLYTSPTPHLSLDREGLLEEAREILDKIAYLTELKPPKGNWGDAVRELVYDKASAFISKLEGSSHAKA